MFNYLLKLGIDPDEPDYDKVTQFNLLSRQGVGNDNWAKVYNKLLDLKVRVDYPDIKEKTPFLNFYENHHLVHSY